MFIHDDLWISYFLHHFKKSKILSLSQHLREKGDGKLSLIYTTHTVAAGLVSTYGENLSESIKKRDQIALESLKYIMEKTENLSF